MKSGDYLRHRFQAWARRHGIPLQGSAGERGEKNYTASLDENLFQPLSKCALREFGDGAGGELNGKMRALHSSSAMAANLFDYWKYNKQFPQLAKILSIPSAGIQSVGFERQFEVIKDCKQYGFREPPHLDLGIEYQNGTRVGVECKLSEPYHNAIHQCLARPYLNLPEAWVDIPNCRHLAEQLSKHDDGYKRLGPCQLIRHILGLKYGLTKDRFRLIYLYLDAPGNEAAEHRAEIERFASVMDADQIRFSVLTVQEFIFRALKLYRVEHNKYIDYLAERYA